MATNEEKNNNGELTASPIETLPLYLDSLCCETGRIRVVHNVAAAGEGLPVNVSLNGKTILEGVVYKQYTPYLQLPVGKYLLEIKQVGTDLVLSTEFHLCGKQDLTFIASGTPNTDDDFALVISEYDDNNRCPGCGRGKVRAIHGSPGAPNVDILVNDRVVFSNVAYGEATPFAKLSPRSYNIKINVTGTSTTVYDADVLVESGTNYTLLASGIVGNEDTPFTVIPIINDCTSFFC